MPAPITVLRTGTGWTVDVTPLVLSSNLGSKDFLVKVGGAVSSNANFTKTNSTLLTYTGPVLAANTPVIVFRDSTRFVDDFLAAEINSSSALNLRFTQVETIVEDLRQMVNP